MSIDCSRSSSMSDAENNGNRPVPDWLNKEELTCRRRKRYAPTTTMYPFE
jgi:hypothetical protein